MIEGYKAGNWAGNKELHILRDISSWSSPACNPSSSQQHSSTSSKPSPPDFQSSKPKMRFSFATVVGLAGLAVAAPAPTAVREEQLDIASLLSGLLGTIQGHSASIRMPLSIPHSTFRPLTTPQSPSSDLSARSLLSSRSRPPSPKSQMPSAASPRPSQTSPPRF